MYNFSCLRWDEPYIGLSLIGGLWKWDDNSLATDVFWASDNISPNDPLKPYAYLTSNSLVIQDGTDGRRGFWCEVPEIGM